MPPLDTALKLPILCAPMFIVSQPELVIAQCLNGVIGSFPALNARPADALPHWLERITQALKDQPDAAPFAVNQIIHPSNTRLQQDLAVCVRYQVPLIITSLSAPTDIVPHVHAYGGKVFHDVINVRHAKKALDAGVDGLILVCAGAGGHAGTLSPFAFVSEVRQFWDGPIALSGAISNGQGVLAAQALGANYAYMGTRFIATHEAQASDAYKQAIIESNASDILYTPYFTGVHGNYLIKSIVAAGLDPKHLPERDKSSMDFGQTQQAKAWKDIWGAGQGVGSISKIMHTSALIAQLSHEYAAARALLGIQN